MDVEKGTNMKTKQWPHHSPRRAIAALCVAVLALGHPEVAKGENESATPFSASGRTRSGRSVKALSDTVLGVSIKGEWVVVSFGEHKLTLEKERLLLDGKKKTPLPASARFFKVTCVDNKLSVVADGKPVLNTSIRADPRQH